MLLLSTLGTYKVVSVSSVMSDSLQPHGLWPTRLLCPWDFPGKNTGLGCHSFLQRIFPTQGLNPCLLHWQAYSLPLSHQGSPKSFLTLSDIISTGSGCKDVDILEKRGINILSAARVKQICHSQTSSLEQGGRRSQGKEVQGSQKQDRQIKLASRPHPVST